MNEEKLRSALHEIVNWSNFGSDVRILVRKKIDSAFTENTDKCPDCDGKGYSVQQGCLVATRIPCKYCDGTGKANTVINENKNEVSKND